MGVEPTSPTWKDGVSPTTPVPHESDMRESNPRPSRWHRDVQTNRTHVATIIAEPPPRIELGPRSYRNRVLPLAPQRRESPGPESNRCLDGLQPSAFPLGYRDKHSCSSGTARTCENGLTGRHVSTTSQRNVRAVFRQCSGRVPPTGIKPVTSGLKNRRPNR